MLVPSLEGCNEEMGNSHTQPATYRVECQMTVKALAILAAPVDPPGFSIPESKGLVEGEKNRETDAESSCEPIHHVDGRRLQAPLQIADVGPVQVCAVGEFFLARSLGAFGVP
jgi:hypothetical protein